MNGSSSLEYPGSSVHEENGWKIATNAETNSVESTADLVTSLLGIDLVWEGQRKRKKESRGKGIESRVGEVRTLAISCVRNCPAHDCGVRDTKWMSCG